MVVAVAGLVIQQGIMRQPMEQEKEGHWDHQVVEVEGDRPVQGAEEGEPDRGEEDHQTPREDCYTLRRKVFPQNGMISEWEREKTLEEEALGEARWDRTRGRRRKARRSQIEGQAQPF